MIRVSKTKTKKFYSEAPQASANFFQELLFFTVVLQCFYYFNTYCEVEEGSILQVPNLSGPGR